MLTKAYLLYNTVRAEDSSKVNGICRCITGRTFGCSKVFPKRSKYSRDKFLNSLGKNGSLFRAADKKRRFLSCPILKGRRINSLSSSFKSVSSRHGECLNFVLADIQTPKWLLECRLTQGYTKWFQVVIIQVKFLKVDEVSNCSWKLFYMIMTQV